MGHESVGEMHDILSTILRMALPKYHHAVLPGRKVTGLVWYSAPDHDVMVTAAVTKVRRLPRSPSGTVEGVAVVEAESSSEVEAEPTSSGMGGKQEVIPVPYYEKSDNFCK